MYKSILVALAASILVALGTPATPQALTGPPSADRLGLARQVFELQGDEKSLTESLYKTLSVVRPVSPQSASQIDAIIQRHIPELSQIYTNIYAREFNEEQLRAIVAFYKSPAGRALSEKKSAILDDSIRELSPVFAKIIGEVRAATCVPPKCTRCDGPNCPPPPPLMLGPSH